MADTKKFWSWRQVAGLGVAALLGVALAPAVNATDAPQDDRSGGQIVQTVCAACHASGESDAPQIGDEQAWDELAERGLTGLTASALEGIRNMPAHGGDMALSDIEIERAITWMVNQSGGDWVEPADRLTPALARTGEQVVRVQCGRCHETGVNGAPPIGDREAWVERIARAGGVDALVRVAIHGHGPMPARGGLADLTDEEIRAAILFMYNPESAAGEGGLR